MAVSKGRAWVFGDGISTDHIAPGRYFHLRSDLPELAKHVLEDARAEFAGAMKPGDFVVGGCNFGQGSSREHAPLIIKLAGVSAVIAKSFARIFYRNCFNVGIPAVILDTSTIADGDELELDTEKGVLRNLTRAEDFTFPPVPGSMKTILDDGGLVEHIKKHGDFMLG